MGGKDTTFEELTGKTNASQGSTNALGQQSTTPKEAGTVSFEELMGRGRGDPGGGRQDPSRPRVPTASEPNPDLEVGQIVTSEVTGPGSTRAPFTVPPRFGLNHPHTYWQRWKGRPQQGTVISASSKYGGDTAPFGDAGMLGATVVRQLGSRDLGWPKLAYDPSSEESFLHGQPVELSAGMQLMNSRQIPPRPSMPNDEWLAEALGAAHAAGVKVLLTFGAQGAGECDVPTAPTPPTSAGEWEPTVIARDGQTYELNLRSIFLMDWTQVHGGRAEDGHAFPVHARAGAGPGAAWHMRSLDVSAPYKRVYLRKIAEAVGNLLVDVDTRLREAYGLSLTDVVEGIELFNEVEHGNRYTRTLILHDPEGPSQTVQIVEPYESGLRWGRACFHVAYGLRTALDALSDGDEVKIRLPGICSYSDGRNERWENRLQSLEGLAAGFVEEAVYYLVTSSYGLGWSETDVLTFLPRVLQGIDYHYYHAGELDDDDHVQHIGYLVFEVAEIEQWIVDAVNGAWHSLVRPDQDVLSTFPVSVLENGCSAAAGHGYVPAGLTREEFQAFEVIHRLGGALAAGASMVGWHSWMSGESASFMGYGLREDKGDWDAPPEDATQRLSWFAYQRFTSLFAGATSGGMVLPQVASRDELVAFLASTGAHPFVVLGFEGAFAPPDPSGSSTWPTSFPYAWLVLRDPSFPQSSRMRLFATWAHSASGNVAVAVPLIAGPSGIALGLGSLPYQAPLTARSTEVELGSVVELPLLPEDGPVFLLSTAMVSWTISP